MQGLSPTFATFCRCQMVEASWKFLVIPFRLSTLSFSIGLALACCVRLSTRRLNFRRLASSRLTSMLIFATPARTVGFSMIC